MNKEETQFKSAKRKELEERVAKGDTEAIKALAKMNMIRDKSRLTREKRTPEQEQAYKEYQNKRHHEKRGELEKRAAEGDPEAKEKLQTIAEKSKARTDARREELKRKIELGDEEAINEVEEIKARQLVRTKKNLLLNPKVMTDEQMRRKREYDLNRVNRIRGKNLTSTNERNAAIGKTQTRRIMKGRRPIGSRNATRKKKKTNGASALPDDITDMILGLEEDDLEDDDFGHDDFGYDDFGRDDFGQDDMGEDDSGDDNVDYGSVVEPNYRPVFDDEHDPNYHPVFDDEHAFDETGNPELNDQNYDFNMNEHGDAQAAINPYGHDLDLNDPNFVFTDKPDNVDAQVEINPSNYHLDINDGYNDEYNPNFDFPEIIPPDYDLNLNDPNFDFDANMLVDDSTAGGFRKRVTKKRRKFVTKKRRKHNTKKRRKQIQKHLTKKRRKTRRK